MTLYVLDTDIAGFAFQRHPTVLQRLQRLPEDDLVVCEHRQATGKSAQNLLARLRAPAQPPQRA